MFSKIIRVPSIFTVFLLIVVSISRATAAIFTDPVTVTNAVKGADVVLVAEIQGFSPKKATTGPLNIGATGMEFRSAGSYQLRVIQIIKGDCERSFRLRLPALTSYFYPSSHFVITPKSALFILKWDRNRNLEPVDPVRPFVPLSGSLRVVDAGPTAVDTVNRVLALSMEDTNLLEFLMQVLRDSYDPNLIPIVAKYVNDSNVSVQDNTLYFLAVNQQVGAIPLIVQLQDRLWATGSEELYSCVEALTQYNSPLATSYLNRALFAQSKYTRNSANEALGNLKNSSSIPYLLITIRDVDHDPETAVPADSNLHFIVPDVSPYDDPKEFIAHRAAEIELFTAWWTKMLQEKRQKNTPVSAKERVDMDSLSDRPDQLNPLLFDYSVFVRRAAMNKLSIHADRSSVPYLLIALSDCDNEIVYKAFVSLHSLIEPAMPTANVTDFNRHFAEQTAPFFRWWNDEISGKHRAKTSHK